MKITYLLTKRLALLIFIILLSTSVLAEKILILGDSQYAGPFGKELDNLLKKSGNEVESYGCVSANINWYLTGTGLCKSSLGSTISGKVQEYTAPKIDNLISSFNPTIVIITAGNMGGFTENKIKDLSKKLIESSTKNSAKCIWVSPKFGPTNSAEDIQKLIDLLTTSIGDKCTIISSIPLVKFNFCGDDIGQSTCKEKIPVTISGKNYITNIHLTAYGSEGIRVGKEWAQGVFNESKSIQGGTFSPSSPPSSSSVNILHIGDSHTAISAYGTELQKLLLTTGATINTYARSGSTPQNWLDGTTGTSFYINNNNGRKSSSDSFNLKDLKSQFNPNIIIITLGTNVISSNTIKTQSEQLAKLAVQGGTKCYWVGPPKITTNLKDNLDQAIVDINSAVSPYCTFIDSKPLSDESKLNIDGIHYNDQGGKELAQGVFNEYKSKQGSITPGKASASSSIPSSIPSSAASTPTKIIQSTCTNQQSCKEIDEVWASRIGAFVNPDLSNKVFAVPGGWIPFEQLYAQPKPVIATVDTYVPTTTTSKSGSCGVASYGTPEQRALLDTIASVEGGSSYNLMYCGKTFSDYSQHPYKTSAMPTPITCAKYSSTAAGRYQFLYGTYTDLKGKGYFNDFGPSEQDRAAGYLIRSVSDEEIKTAINTKNFISIWDKFATKWSSFPYSGKSTYGECTPDTCGYGKSYYGQKARSDQFLKDRFFQCYEIQKNKQP